MRYWNKLWNGRKNGLTGWRTECLITYACIEGHKKYYLHDYTWKSKRQQRWMCNLLVSSDVRYQHNVVCAFRTRGRFVFTRRFIFFTCFYAKFKLYFILSVTFNCVMYAYTSFIHVQKVIWWKHANIYIIIHWYRIKLEICLFLSWCWCKSVKKMLP